VGVVEVGRLDQALNGGIMEDVIRFLRVCWAYRLLIFTGVSFSFAFAVIVYVSSTTYQAQITVILDTHYMDVGTYATLAQLPGLGASVSKDGISVVLTAQDKLSKDSVAESLASKLSILQSKAAALLPDYQARIDAAEIQYQTLETTQARISLLNPLANEIYLNKQLLAEKDRMVTLSDVSASRKSHPLVAVFAFCLGVAAFVALAHLIEGWKQYGKEPA
jgi:hypothetical protein